MTGGGTGIGLAITHALARRDNRILVAARRREPLDAVAAAYPAVSIATVDLVDESAIRGLVSQAERDLGGITVLINNAGIQFNDRYATDDPDEICAHVDREIGTNLTGLVKLTTLAMPQLRRAAEAAVVNVSSILAYSPKMSAPVYSATKAAVRSFTQALRYQMAAQAPHIAVVEVLPPIVDTPMTEGRGRRKLSPDRVARETVRGIERGRTEIRPGATKLVRWIHRAAPSIVERRLRRL